MFRKLNKNEIECRVANTTQKGIMLLLYKDARVDQRLLDETFGVFGWQRHHEVIDGNLYCTVSVKNPETGEWIEKQDVGTESYTEKEKGQASDSFKRACFNWGIGRELYTAPTIWVAKGNYKENSKGSTYDRFKVEEIGYDENGNINALDIINVNMDKVVYSLVAPVEAPLSDATANDQITEDEWAEIEDLIKRANVNKPKLLKNYKIESLMQLTRAQYTTLKEKCMEAIKE